MKTFTSGLTPKDVIFENLPETYEMELVGSDADLVVELINQGIDSRLEAIVTNKHEWRHNRVATKLYLEVPKPGMVCLLRRLWERFENDGNEEAFYLRSDILSTIGIEEV